MWLRSSLYLHLAVIQFFKDLVWSLLSMATNIWQAYRTEPLTAATVTLKHRLNEIFWPPTIIEAGTGLIILGKPTDRI